MAKKRILTTGFSMHTADKFACIPKKLIFDCPMQELRADGLHWLLLIYLSAKAGMQDSRATLNTKTDLASLLRHSHHLKPDGNTIKNAISTLEDLEKMGLLHISVESEGRLVIHFAH
ncbi:hypothetical protein IH879_19865 [candidate division KSB1 bacterium]|nr:hypothetical protein [candidate division KSB1 bacterium]